MADKDSRGFWRGFGERLLIAVIQCLYTLTSSVLHFFPSLSRRYGFRKSPKYTRMPGGHSEAEDLSRDAVSSEAMKGQRNNQGQCSELLQSVAPVQHVPSSEHGTQTEEDIPIQSSDKEGDVPQLVEPGQCLLGSSQVTQTADNDDPCLQDSLKIYEEEKTLEELLPEQPELQYVTENEPHKRTVTVSKIGLGLNGTQISDNSDSVPSILEPMQDNSFGQDLSPLCEEWQGSVKGSDDWKEFLDQLLDDDSDHSLESPSVLESDEDEDTESDEDLEELISQYQKLEYLQKQHVQAKESRRDDVKMCLELMGSDGERGTGNIEISLMVSALAENSSNTRDSPLPTEGCLVAYKEQIEDDNMREIDILDHARGLNYDCFSVTSEESPDDSISLVPLPSLTQTSERDSSWDQYTEPMEEEHESLCGESSEPTLDKPKSSSISAEASLDYLLQQDQLQTPRDNAAPGDLLESDAVVLMKTAESAFKCNSEQTTDSLLPAIKKENHDNSCSSDPSRPSAVSGEQEDCLCANAENEEMEMAISCEGGRALTCSPAVSLLPTTTETDQGGLVSQKPHQPSESQAEQIKMLKQKPENSTGEYKLLHCEKTKLPFDHSGSFQFTTNTSNHDPCIPDSTESPSEEHVEQTKLPERILGNIQMQGTISSDEIFEQLLEPPESLHLVSEEEGDEPYRGDAEIGCQSRDSTEQELEDMGETQEDLYMENSESLVEQMKVVAQNLDNSLREYELLHGEKPVVQELEDMGEKPCSRDAEISCQSRDSTEQGREDMGNMREELSTESFEENMDHSGPSPISTEVNHDDSFFHEITQVHEQNFARYESIELDLEAIGMEFEKTQEEIQELSRNNMEIVLPPEEESSQDCYSDKGHLQSPEESQVPDTLPSPERRYSDDVEANAAQQREGEGTTEVCTAYEGTMKNEGCMPSGDDLEQETPKAPDSLVRVDIEHLCEAFLPLPDFSRSQENVEKTGHQVREEDNSTVECISDHSFLRNRFFQPPGDQLQQQSSDEKHNDDSDMHKNHSLSPETLDLVDARMTAAPKRKAKRTSTKKRSTIRTTSLNDERLQAFENDQKQQPKSLDLQDTGRECLESLHKDYSLPPRKWYPLFPREAFGNKPWMKGESKLDRKPQKREASGSGHCVLKDSKLEYPHTGLQDLSEEYLENLHKDSFHSKKKWHPLFPCEATEDKPWMKGESKLERKPRKGRTSGAGQCVLEDSQLEHPRTDLQDMSDDYLEYPPKGYFHSKKKWHPLFPREAIGDKPWMKGESKLNRKTRKRRASGSGQCVPDDSELEYPHTGLQDTNEEYLEFPHKDYSLPPEALDLPEAHKFGSKPRKGYYLHQKQSVEEGNAELGEANHEDDSEQEKRKYQDQQGVNPDCSENLRKDYSLPPKKWHPLFPREAIGDKPWMKRESKQERKPRKGRASGAGQCVPDDSELEYPHTDLQDMSGDYLEYPHKGYFHSKKKCHPLFPCEAIEDKPWMKGESNLERKPQTGRASSAGLCVPDDSEQEYPHKDDTASPKPPRGVDRDGRSWKTKGRNRELPPQPLLLVSAKRERCSDSETPVTSGLPFFKNI